jgi:hypothetical protein
MALPGSDGNHAHHNNRLAHFRIDGVSLLGELLTEESRLADSASPAKHGRALALKKIWLQPPRLARSLQ